MPAGENFKHKHAKELDKEDAVGVHRQVLGVGAKQLVHKQVVLDQIANVTSPALTSRGKPQVSPGSQALIASTAKSIPQPANVLTNAAWQSGGHRH